MICAGQYESSCSLPSVVTAGNPDTQNTARQRHSLSGEHDENRKRQTAQFSGKETHRWMLVLTEMEWMIIGSGEKGCTTMGMS